MWILLGFLAAFSWPIYLGAMATVRGHYLTTLAVFGWTVMPVVVGVAMTLVSLGRTSLRASYDLAGTTIRPDRRFNMLCFGAAAAAIPGCLVFAIFVTRGALDLPMSRGMQLYTSTMMSAMVFTLVSGLIIASRRGGMGYLRLSPSVIESANVAFTNYYDWDDVVDIKDHSETKRTRKPIVLCMRDGSESIIEGADIYVPRGASLYWMVRHYWRNADQRVELTNDRAVKRLRDGEFDLT